MRLMYRPNTMLHTSSAVQIIHSYRTNLWADQAGCSAGAAKLDAVWSPYLGMVSLAALQALPYCSQLALQLSTQPLLSCRRLLHSAWRPLLMQLPAPQTPESQTSHLCRCRSGCLHSV